MNPTNTMTKAEYIEWTTAAANANAALPRNIAHELARKARQSVRELRVPSRSFHSEQTNSWVVNSSADISVVLNPEKTNAAANGRQPIPSEYVPARPDGTKPTIYPPALPNASTAVKTSEQIQAEATAQREKMKVFSGKEGLNVVRNIDRKIRTTAREILQSKTYGDLQKVEGLTLDANTGKITLKVV